MGTSITKIWLWSQGLKGTKDQVVGHLYQLKEEKMLKLKYELVIDNTFTDEQVSTALQDYISWFTNLANYLVIDVAPKELSF